MRIAGIIQVQVGGEVLRARGAFTYNIGAPKREAVLGSDEVHGYKELPQVPFIEGEISDHISVDLAKLLNTRDATVTCKLAVGKTIVLHRAWYAGEGTGNTEEGSIGVRFEAMQGEELKAA